MLTIEAKLRQWFASSYCLVNVKKLRAETLSQNAS